VEIESHAGELKRNIALLFILSLSLGITHISLSLISRIAAEYKTKEGLYPLSLLLILSSVLPFSLGFKVAGSILIIPGLALLFYAKGLGFFEEIIVLFANILSYIRIGALATMHITFSGIFTRAILSLPDNILGIALAAVLFLLGSGIILASSTFLVFIHSLRLHWVEFFRRFYSGMGEKYMPFREESYYIYEV